MLEAFGGWHNYKGILCSFSKHRISKKDIARLNGTGTEDIEIRCQRCRLPLSIRSNPENPPSFFVKEL